MKKDRTLLASIAGTKRRSAVPSRVDVFLGLDDLVRALTGVVRQPEERLLLRYFPIAAVAYAETFFKYAVAELIDSGGKYLDSLESFLKKRDVSIDADVLRAMHGRRVTVGEVVAFSLRYSGKDQIAGYLTSILGRDFLAALREHWPTFRANPWKHVPHDAAECPADIGPVLAAVDRAYEFRHIFSHEAAVGHQIMPWEATQAVENVIWYLSAANDFLQLEVTGFQGTSQAEINQALMDRFAAEDRRTTELFEAMVSQMDPDEARSARETQATWRAYRDGHAELLGDLVAKGGTMRSAVVSTELIEMTRARHQQLLNAQMDLSLPEAEVGLHEPEDASDR